MSRKKKQKKEVKRPYRVPMDYVGALADSIHQQNPTVQILTNTLADFYSVAFARGYQRRIHDHNYFKAKMEKHRKDAFDQFKDEIDDEIHNKNNS